MYGKFPKKRILNLLKMRQLYLKNGIVVEKIELIKTFLRIKVVENK